MKYSALIFLGSILLFAGGFIIVYPDLIGLCTVGDRSCIHFYPVFEVGEPLLIGSISLILISFILLFFSEEVFKTWERFAIVYLPLAIILVLLTPVTASFLNPDRELATWWLSVIFLLVSFIIIARKSWRLRKEKTKVITK